jgi:hypothetical protein
VNLARIRRALRWPLDFLVALGVFWLAYFVAHSIWWAAGASLGVALYGLWCFYDGLEGGAK